MDENEAFAMAASERLRAPGGILEQLWPAIPEDAWEVRLTIRVDRADRAALQATVLVQRRAEVKPS